MKKTTVYCDICGVDITDRAHTGSVDIEIFDRTAPELKAKLPDACGKCIGGLSRVIRDFMAAAKARP